MAVTYQSTDTNAPTLDTSAGSLITLLKACLVDGYSGKLAAGWTVEYEDGPGNIAVFRNSASGGSGAYFRVDDSVGKWARFRAYSSMSDVNTGSDPSPTTTWWTNGLPLVKSRSGTASWIVHADQHTCYIQVEGTDLQGFGDFESFVPGDDFRYFIAGIRNSESNARGPGWGIVGNKRFWSVSDGRGAVVGKAADQISDPPEFSIPRPGHHSGSGNSILYSVHGGSSSISDPDTATGLRMFVPAFIACEGLLRGRLRGLYVPLHNLTAEANAAIEDAPAGLPVDSRLMIMKCIPFPSTNSQGTLAVEVGVGW